MEGPKVPSEVRQPGGAKHRTCSAEGLRFEEDAVGPPQHEPMRVWGLMPAEKDPKNQR